MSTDTEVGNDAESRHKAKLQYYEAIPLIEAKFDDDSTAADFQDSEGNFLCLVCENTEPAMSSHFCPKCFTQLCIDCALAHIKTCKDYHDYHDEAEYPESMQPCNRPCKFWALGNCKEGDRCRFSHAALPATPHKVQKKNQPMRGTQQAP
jgi:hypothetical protein